MEKVIKAPRFLEVEESLDILFDGVQIAGVLNDVWFTCIRNNRLDISRKRKYQTIALRIKHWLLPRKNNHAPAVSENGVLMALSNDTSRIVDLMLPVLDEFNGYSCSVLCCKEDIKANLPAGVSKVIWNECLIYSPNDWRSFYSRNRKKWNINLKKICSKSGLPEAAYQQLSFTLMIASQYIMGYLNYLLLTRPKVIITDYDRNHRCSCLVIAAKLAGIPTVTLTHGVMSMDADGYAPVLADKIISWGELDRDKLIKAGVEPEKIIIGGCPRLSRELNVDSVKSRIKMGLDRQRKVVMFASTPERERFEYVKAFCEAIEKQSEYVGFVRLHPSEKMSTYKHIIEEYPAVHFFENTISTLDEALAVSDVVVTHGSGVGLDALVKRRMTVIMDFEVRPFEYNSDWVYQAGCPHVRTSGELSNLLKKTLVNFKEKKEKINQAEVFLKKAFVAYGSESAKLIADKIKDYIKFEN